MLHFEIINHIHHLYFVHVSIIDSLHLYSSDCTHHTISSSFVYERSPLSLTPVLLYILESLMKFINQSIIHRLPAAVVAKDKISLVLSPLHACKFGRSMRLRIRLAWSSRHCACVQIWSEYETKGKVRRQQAGVPSLRTSDRTREKE